MELGYINLQPVINIIYVQMYKSKIQMCLIVGEKELMG